MKGGYNDKPEWITKLPNGIEKLKITVITLQNNLKKMDNELTDANKELANCKNKVRLEGIDQKSTLGPKLAAAATGYMAAKGGGYKTLKKRNRKSKTRRNMK